MTVKKTDAQWRSELTDEQYRVCRLKGTEAPFTGEYAFHKKDGTYHCSCCQRPLFDSSTKFDAGCGWPSFYDVMDCDSIVTVKDFSHGMERIEVTCAHCQAHLGHVFPDGPAPTGLRYCINSVALGFQEQNLEGDD